MLGHYNVKATFFVPGAVAVKFPEALRFIASAGHEIGCHGFEHEHMAMLSPEKQYDVMRKGKEAIIQVCGKEPVGFHVPEGEFSMDTLVAAKKLGFSYSSSLSTDDVPYYLNLGDGEGELYEIPIHWSLYDLPYFSFHFWPPLPNGQPRIACSDKVLNNWKWEYDVSTITEPVMFYSLILSVLARREKSICLRGYSIILTKKAAHGSPRAKRYLIFTK